jgi:putative oxidoreductase
MVQFALEATASVALGGIFIAAAVPKLRRPKSFEVIVMAYDILPPAASRVYARMLPPAELSLGLLLPLGVATRVAALASCLLIAGFVFGVGVNVLRGRDLDCGCFGKRGNRTVGPRLLLEDLVLLAGSVWLVERSPGWLSPAAWSPLRALPGDSLLNAAILLSVAAVAALILSTRASRRGRAYGEHAVSIETEKVAT